MRLAVAATPRIAIPTLEAILESKHQLEIVITQPDRAAGRGKLIQESPVSFWAKGNDITILKPNKSNELADISKSVDCVVTVGYGVILPKTIIDLPKYGYLNLHFSLLPKWRGAAPVQRAIQFGDRETGVSVFKLDSGMDTGPIYVQRKMNIPDDFRSSELFSALSQIGALAVLQTLEAIEQGVSPVPQLHMDATKAEKISKEEARIDWNSTSQKIFRNIKAFYPAPVAWTTFRNQVLRIEKAQISQISGLSPGQLRVVERELHVGTCDGSLQIHEFVPSGKKSMDVKSWLNGARIEIDECFE